MWADARPDDALSQQALNGHCIQVALLQNAPLDDALLQQAPLGISVLSLWEWGASGLPLRVSLIHLRTSCE